jgi:nucleoside phosphorylase
MQSINTIVVPQGAEYQAVRRGLAKTQGKDRIQVVAIPLGVTQMSQVLADNDAIISNASNVIIMGLCGSLSDVYAVGDSIVVKSCVNLDYHLVDLDAELSEIIQRKLAKPAKSSPEVNLVTALTSDRIIIQAEEKRILANKYSATVVEMEGYSYVKELQRQGAAVAMIRVISDDLRGDLPNLNQAIDDQGNLQTLPLAIALIKQPIAAIRLIRGSLMGLKVLETIAAKLF